MTVIDASNLIMGRLASEVAKKLLNGEEIIIVNSEKCVITGSKRFLTSLYKTKQTRGSPEKGPYFPKRPDKILRRTIRGMLPFKKARGKEAYRRLKVYVGVPNGINDYETMPAISLSNLSTIKYVHLEDISRRLGSRF
ncbi:MAG: 50S ribosomal protein L13 [Candidatus Methanoliparum thermophilum]|uniref:Large ribosomal subunit protein uL13 n=1 Tax=Methanoliparum thermophilum TaxID=2491083 RepID=A0A520KTU3_METT2|nr:50S ribosomal protein L13 [Candidatus Methanoliparum sp. LAM-1]RZN65497.1 MAG: 50S ribosomal protein L13 [Candidatus Methanoliparum thermophilum]BDC35408.1 50S ribosomal protein L13 [Candidatus Methanoliparum sp. LAM-1]